MALALRLFRAVPEEVRVKFVKLVIKEPRGDPSLPSVRELIRPVPRFIGLRTKSALAVNAAFRLEL